MDVIILAFKLSVITRKMFNFSEMCLFDGHKSHTLSSTCYAYEDGGWLVGNKRKIGRRGRRRRRIVP